MKKLIVSGIAAACLMGTVTAKAEEVQVRVNHTDLDLTRSGDVVKLRSRLRIAIQDACSSRPGDYPFTAINGCFTEAMAEADAQIAARRALAQSPTKVAKN